MSSRGGGFPSSRTRGGSVISKRGPFSGERVSIPEGASGGTFVSGMILAPSRMFRVDGFRAWTSLRRSVIASLQSVRKQCGVFVTISKGHPFEKCRS